MAPITSPGRPSDTNGEETCKLAKNMARAGLSHTMMARIFGIAPSTFSLWKAQHPAFLKALERGTEQVGRTRTHVFRHVRCSPWQSGGGLLNSSLGTEAWT